MFTACWRHAQLLCARAEEPEIFSSWADFIFQAAENKNKEEKKSVQRVESKVNEGYRYVYSPQATVYLNNIAWILKIQS